MPFLWSTPAGQIDFWAMMAVAAFAMAFGGRVSRIMASVMVFAFLADRAALWFAPIHAFPMIAAGAALVGVSAVTALTRQRIALAFAALFFFKGLACAGLALGIPFDSTATAVTAIAYFQMLLILGGSANGIGRRLSHLWRNGSGVHHGGSAHGIHFVEGGLSPVSSPSVPHFGGSQAPHFLQKN